VKVRDVPLLAVTAFLLFHAVSALSATRVQLSVVYKSDVMGRECERFRNPFLP
jgi:hypothetical protein